MQQKVRIPLYDPGLNSERLNQLLELLISTQLLFLNNFCEPLCKKAKSTLKAIFDRFRLNMTAQGSTIIVGDAREKEMPDLSTDIKYYTLHD